MRKTLSFSSMLAKGDAEVFDNLTADEINNPLGTVPKGGFPT